MDQLKDHNTIREGKSLHKQGKASGWTFTAVFFLHSSSLFLPRSENVKFFHTENALDTELHST